LTAPETRPPPSDAQVSTNLLLRITILLIGAWTAVAGLVLLAFQGASSGVLGAGVTDENGKRLAGVHMLLLVPVYLLIAWRYDRYAGLLWLPFAGQLAVVLVVGYAMVIGDTRFSDGILAVAVGLIFVSLFGFLWITQQRTIARLKMEADTMETEAAGQGDSAGQVAKTD
jgi:hypothetical protein